jgi:hypothetical protein
MYHTVERRKERLTQPTVCERIDAWLGEGYYYWYDKRDAHEWGKKSKRETGEYEIYHSDIDCEDILDTVFNEDHYLFWIRNIEQTAELIRKRTGTKPSVEEINEYFRDRNIWRELTGIMFQDLPSNPNRSLVKDFFYKKRIQLAVYELGIILNFNFLLIEKC